MRNIVLLLSFGMSLLITSCANSMGTQATVKAPLKNGTIVIPADKYNGKWVSQWVDGKLNGVSRSYYKIGKLRKEIHYENGKEDGIMREYYKSGQLKSEVHYQNGKENGLATYWHKNGVKSAVGHYVNGQPIGKTISWHNNGKIRMISYLDKNMNDTGILTEYDEKGNLVLKIDYSGKKPVTLVNTRENSVHEFMKLVEKKKKEHLKKSKTIPVAHLDCSAENGNPSMSEYSRKVAIYRAKGEGAAVGFKMKSKSIQISHQKAENFCITQANIEGLSCTYASEYVAGCMSEF